MWNTSNGNICLSADKYHCDHHGMFQCANAQSSSDCYIPTQICDGVNQCSDGSDESICGKCIR